MELKDAVVVITGASSGIGRATALELAKEGASLVLVARREYALHGLAEECEKLGGKALAAPIDVSIEAHVYGVVEKAINRFGKIDVWINNAAVSVAGHFEEIPSEDFRRVLEINLFGYIHATRAVIPHFKQQGSGTIINVSSMVAMTGEPYFAPYVISKFAIRGLGISLNQELKHEGINVCTVLPAVIDTPLYNQAANYMGKAIKAPGKAISAEEVAFAIIGLIENPQSEIIVGGKARVAAAMRFFAPGVFDQQTEKVTLKEHFEQDKVVKNSKGNLYDPNREFASVSGGWPQRNAISRETYLKYAIPASILSGAAIGLALVFKTKRVREVFK